MPSIHTEKLKVVIERIKNRIYNFKISKGSKKENMIYLLESRDFLKRNNEKARNVENTK